jgi:hypothetical protein
MLLTWIDKIGDWNPQLLREFKGRLNVQNSMIAVTSSLASQGLLLLYFWGQLPSDEKPYFSQYCISRQLSPEGEALCGLDASGHILINWPFWWSSFFYSLSCLSAFALLLSGIYLLISDLAQEERRGTLNFIRLSPQSSQSILIGKLLGVPILPTLVVALAIPLHLITAWEARISTVHVLEIYILIGSIILFFYSASLLLGILAGFPAWLGAGIFLFAGFMLFQFWSWGYLLQEGTEWLGLPLWNSWEIALTFILVSLGIGTYWIWRALHRRFHSPSDGLLSKKQGYWATISFQIFVLGFFLLNQNTYGGISNTLHLLLMCANALWLLALTLAISPHRQALLDWSRYRRDNTSSKIYSLVQDLLWHEKSPALLAMTINLLISAIGLSLWISLWPNHQEKVQAFLGVFFNISILFIYSVIVQLLLFIKTRRPLIWAMSITGAMIIVPILALNILSLLPENLPGLWLFSAFPMAAIAHASTVTLCLGFLGHVGTSGWLIFQLTKQLQKAGESNSKALFADRPRLNSTADIN